MSVQIVVVKRPRGGLFALLTSAPAWLRAVWSGDSVATPGRSGSNRTVARVLDAPPGPPAPAADPAAARRDVGAPVDDASLGAAFSAQGVQIQRSRDGMLRLEVPASEASTVLRRLREEAAFGFDRLLDLTVVDRSEGRGRFEVVYLLAASPHGDRLRVHATGLESDAPEIATAVLLWPAAEWLEREAHDLLGVRFRGHPGLQRILLPPDFEGFPLQKDFVRDTRDEPHPDSGRAATGQPEGGAA